MQTRLDQRTEARYQVDEQETSVTVLANGDCTGATLLNLSKSGAALEVAGPIAPGQPVRFKVGSQVVLGVVRNARWGDGGPLIGLRIEESRELPLTSRE